MIVVVKKLAKAVLKAVDADGLNINMNNEKAAGQEIMHAHIHIVPRFKGDGIYKTPRHLSYSDVEKEDIALKIRDCVKSAK
jgi:histidine triad (HIT) family protein